MNRIISLFIFINLSAWAYAQSLNKTNSTKNSILVSPNINFDWSAALKLKKSNYNNSNLITGLSINYQHQDKLNNYHSAGIIIGIIPISVNNAKASTNNPLRAKQFGVQYNYKVVFAKFKNNSLQIYTAVGSQLIYRKIQTTDINSPSSTHSFMHNFLLTPGFQYSKNNFFIDFSLPTSIGYSISNQKSYYPIFDTNQEQSLQRTTQKYNLLNWNVGFNAGVGAKF